jgi:hypothetical protein
MSDKDVNELKQGLGKDKLKPNWLEEVKQDAAYNYLKRLREQQEKAAFEEAKTKGNVDELIASLKPKKG